MSKVDDGWNVVRLPEKGQLSSSGAVSDDFYVDDDDILSNTSSDEYADLSNPFNLGKREFEKAKTVSDSFDTLTGSKNGGAMNSSGSEKQQSPDDDRRVTLMGSILSRIENFKKPELKVWQVAVVSSLVTVFIIVGTQRYFEILDGILRQKDDVSIRHNSSNKDLIYSDINFLNHDESVSPTWRPTGKYYVDFDNHIAYPLPPKEPLFWRNVKADTAILWYTVRSKCRSWLASESVADFERRCYAFVQNVKKDILQVHNRLVLARNGVLDLLANNFVILKNRAIASLISLRSKSAVLQVRISENARSMNDVWHDRLIPRLRRFLEVSVKQANKSLERCNYALVQTRSWVERFSVPRFESFSKRIFDGMQRWSRKYSRKLKLISSRFKGRRSYSVAERLSAHVKACRHITHKKCRNWQFSKIKVFDN